MSSSYETPAVCSTRDAAMHYARGIWEGKFIAPIMDLDENPGNVRFGDIKLKNERYWLQVETLG